MSIWKSSLPVLFLILLGSCHRDAYHYLKKRKYVECELVGITAWKSDSYPRYEQFRDQTDQEQLKKYLFSKNVILKTYSYWALIEKSAHGYLQLFDRALQETSKISQKCGCRGETTSIASSAYFNFWYSQMVEEGDSLVFSAPQKLYRLDSMIFHHSIQDQELLEVVKMNGLYKGK
ncbi:hypothetical protein CRP01_08565 [Flavilitoribacter nigricans DSM 23189 = NBRC 102662]|uniref:Lipoprotein n=1 Tax=Flavilitoribacter nigricans (strain ATCC 23147 / DSM 23189 / NBRC 102662 / NCIMB 1420 / SS-2) TaxID=1122177 RepID=A0A2D0NES8_FLAN2|nr:hypothetical protein CRP01_08565 [Flavilitoribacter nigricans DSM 23189 = NBRC 102662]